MSNSDSQAIGKRGGAEPDHFAQRGGDGGADPGDAQGAIAAAGADIGADHGDQRAAETEHQRDQQIFEARAGAVAGDGRRAERADEAGGDGDGEIGLHRDQRCDRADAQDVGEQRPAQADAEHGKPHDAAPGAQIGRERHAADRVIDQHRNRAAGDAEPRERA